MSERGTGVAAEAAAFWYCVGPGSAAFQIPPQCSFFRYPAM